MITLAEPCDTTPHLAKPCPDNPHLMKSCFTHGCWAIATVGFGLQHVSIACNKCAPPGETRLNLNIFTPADLDRPALPVQVYESGTTICNGDTTIPWHVVQLLDWTIIYDDGNILIWAVAVKGEPDGLGHCTFPDLMSSVYGFFPHDFPDPGGDRSQGIPPRPCDSPYRVVG